MSKRRGRQYICHLKYGRWYKCHLKRGHQYVCPLKLGHEPKRCHDTLLHGFIAKLFLKEFGSNHVSCHFNTTSKRKFLLLMLIGSFYRTCFITVLHRVHRIRSDNLSLWALALYISRTEDKQKHWFDTQSIGKEIEGWRERQI